MFFHLMRRCRILQGRADVIQKVRCMAVFFKILSDLPLILKHWHDFAFRKFSGWHAQVVPDSLFTLLKNSLALPFTCIFGSQGVSSSYNLHLYPWGRALLPHGWIMALNGKKAHSQSLDPLDDTGY